MALKIVGSFRNKILIPFRLIPKDGLSPEKLAFSVTLGIIAGIFPVIGGTTVLGLLLAMIFRQNLLVIQSVQWILALLQIVIIVPFIKLGGYLLNRGRLPINIQQIKLAFRPGILEGLKTIGILHLYGIFFWALLALPLGIISYFTLLFIFKKKNHSS